MLRSTSLQVSSLPCTVGGSRRYWRILGRHGENHTSSKQLRGIREIRDSDLVSAQSELAVRERATHEAREGTERLQILKNHLEQRARLEADLLANRNSQRQAQELMTNADVIRTDWNRLQELRDVFPHLKSVSDQRYRFTVAEHAIADLTDDETNGLYQ